MPTIESTHLRYNEQRRVRHSYYREFWVCGHCANTFSYTRVHRVPQASLSLWVQAWIYKYSTNEPGWVLQASTLLLKLFSLLKDVYLGSVMVASSVAGVWTSFCGWDSGPCSWTSVCHESTLLLIFPIRWWLESCQVSAALDSLPSSPTYPPFSLIRTKSQHASHILWLSVLSAL